MPYRTALSIQALQCGHGGELRGKVEHCAVNADALFSLSFNAATEGNSVEGCAHGDPLAFTGEVGYDQPAYDKRNQHPPGAGRDDRCYRSAAQDAGSSEKGVVVHFFSFRLFV
jgi:hypothetical protein